MKEVVMISGVSKVVVPVDDQQQAKEFWVDRLGFELQRDESYGDERWIEVSPPGQRLILALTRRTPHEARQELPDQLPHSPVFFNCADIEQTHRRGGGRRSRGARWRGARPSRPRLTGLGLPLVVQTRACRTTHSACPFRAEGRRDRLMPLRPTLADRPPCQAVERHAVKVAVSK
jgi:catechol 2,3-dioxygenase-like lactoylglutathione lyase family enzyme